MLNNEFHYGLSGKKSCCKSLPANKYTINPYEPRCGKTGFAYAKQRRKSAARSCAADQRLCFLYTDSTMPLLPKSEISSSHRLWLYRLVCIGPGRKPRRPVFPQRGSYVTNGVSHLYYLGFKGHQEYLFSFLFHFSTKFM